MNKSEKVFADGYAIGGVSVESGEYFFRFRGEEFRLKKMALSEGRQNRMVPVQYISEFPEYGFRFGMVAKVDDLRKAMAFE